MGAAVQRPAERALFDSLPNEFVGGIFSFDFASAAVFDGGEDEAVVALEFEPANVFDFGTGWVGIALEVVSDGLRFQIDRVRAVIGEVAVECFGFLFLSAGTQSFREGLAVGFDCDLDAHPTRAVVHDEAGGVVVGDVADWGDALYGDELPSAEEFVGDVVLLGLGGESETEEE